MSSVGTDRGAMDPARWRRVRELFAAAQDHELEERETIIRGMAGSEVSLAEEVIALLRRVERMGGFLEPGAGPKEEPEVLP